MASPSDSWPVSTGCERHRHKNRGHFSQRLDMDSDASLVQVGLQRGGNCEVSCTVNVLTLSETHSWQLGPG